MKLWKRIRYFFCVRQKVVSFEVVLKCKTKANMTLGSVRKVLEVEPKIALTKGYVRKSDWFDFDVMEKITKDISDKMNEDAEELLKEMRKKEHVIKNQAGVWISGKHVVGVYWNVKDIKWNDLSFEEYCISKNGNNKFN